MNIEGLYELFKKSCLVDTDTRNIRKGSIFFALKGANFNGNKFAEEALNKGASYAVVDEEEYKRKGNIILVEDVLTSLQKLANYHRRQLKCPIIALTGSNGKTTTKELINVVLSKKYKVNATKGNLNNHIGVPLTLLSMTEDTEVGVVEMGANHHKEIALLSGIAEPDFGYITNFGKAHLEGFGSVEGVIEAKSELYDFLIVNDKKVFVNPSDKIQMQKTEKAKRILFSSDIRFEEVNPFVKLSYNTVQIQSNLIGKYNYNNIAVAITIGVQFDVAMDDIKEAIESYAPDNNRSQIIKKNSNKIILDAYNANPTSVQAAIENFKLLKDSFKVVILGDMFELGENSHKEHQYIVDLMDACEFDESIVVGANFYDTTTNSQQFINFESLKEKLLTKKYTNATILVKGSRGMALERVLEYLN
ncbi:UDP-N-acetylmuramoyl-tripeptide--D-alanyl-D-alanine ligase [Tenacibaculum sp. 190130A14a]|uniref:UDP-N-acetylmuramoyl-tripeptide--D-alanyl-D-alanine ligase n=1 Tax=Tenacibaculum polynesiense TaxID=3137857 RepID=A0ABP1EUH9_9FLAO